MEAGGLGQDCESLYPLPGDVDKICRIFTWQQQASKEDKKEKVEVQTDKEDKSEKEGMENVAQKAGPIFDLNEPHPPVLRNYKQGCASGSGSGWIRNYLQVRIRIRN